MRRTAAITSLLTAFVTVASLVWPAAAGALPPPRVYVAMGDSYTASPLTSAPVDSPAGCLRSDNNYPRVARAAMGMETFVDISCSGAKTDESHLRRHVERGAHKRGLSDSGGALDDHDPATAFADRAQRLVEPRELALTLEEHRCLRHRPSLPRREPPAST